MNSSPTPPSSDTIEDPARALRRAKRQALGLLLLVTAVFVATSVVERGLWLNGAKAMAEAAMVGALADWFAVVALFRRPLGLPIPHTAVIARNQARIGRNLATFVRDKFLDVPSLVALIRRHDPAERLAQWLTAPGNAALLGHQATRLASAALETVQDAQVERFIQKAARALIGQVDMSRALAAVLDTLTHNGRHQALLDDVLEKLIELLHNEQTRAWVAQTIVLWLKKDHRRTEKLLPSDWLGDKGSALLARALESVMADVADNPQHALRAQFDAAVQRFIERLRSDPDWVRKGEEIRTYLQTDATVAGYVQTLWQDLRGALRRDLADADSVVARQVRNLGQWLGQSLAGDAALRQSLNDRLEHWVQGLAPDVSQFVAQHIEDTVRRWDTEEMTQLIELNIGKDLQYIRINGTVVGGLIGLVLFAVSHVGEIWRAAVGG
ncbi:hypothetical protein ASF11_00785 [Acidovorax sp. Leaf76]|uniref:DUF445 domain-containing protein n=1 Tax=unclassified Acidovorax TaxID=2684926 RepID=UPI000700FCC2|nr:MULTISPECIES: DUF445 family protein [unclassified Acidovorax]KQO26285.1 hypothetical protein ASF11_00785 [Acidovorax sp. Leaf76]KQS38304.1 hypothetical protein ASG27_23290 [Acidovorax sp. Leaf191]